VPSNLLQRGTEKNGANKMQIKMEKIERQKDFVGECEGHLGKNFNCKMVDSEGKERKQNRNKPSEVNPKRAFQVLRVLGGKTKSASGDE